MTERLLYFVQKIGNTEAGAVRKCPDDVADLLLRLGTVENGQAIVEISREYAKANGLSIEGETASKPEPEPESELEPELESELEPEPGPVKRGRGRPAGSKNRPKTGTVTPGGFDRPDAQVDAAQVTEDDGDDDGEHTPGTNDDEF